MNQHTQTAAEAICDHFRVATPLHPVARIVQEAIDATLRDLFLTMPVPPDDVASVDGLQAYHDAVENWREAAGYPSVYDGPVG